MEQEQIKKGQKVVATARDGSQRPGKVVEVIPGFRGAFVEVDHGEGKTNRYRPSALAAA